jgi:heptosyltransferase II
LQRILVVAPNWIGDALMAQPLLVLLKQSGAAIDVLAPEWVAPVTRRMAEVDHVIAAPFRHGALQLGARRRLGRELKGRGYDKAIVLPNTWKSALVPFLARIPQRIGYVGEMRYGLLTSRLQKTNAPMPLHYARLAGEPDGELSRPHLEVTPAEVAETRRGFGLGGPYAVFCPGAEYGPAKRWPYFKDLAGRLGMPVVLLGSTKDQDVAQGIRGKNLVGQTTLDDAIRIIAGADLVVSNDSGLMHIAAALGRPQIALFGSSSPEHTPPASPSARVLWLRLECSPCFARECPLGHFRCMKDLSVERVLAEVNKLVSKLA